MSQRGRLGKALVVGYMYDIIMAAEKRTDNKGDVGQDQVFLLGARSPTVVVNGLKREILRMCIALLSLCIDTPGCRK